MGNVAVVANQIGSAGRMVTVEVCASWSDAATDDEVNAALLQAVGKFAIAYAEKRNGAGQ